MPQILQVLLCVNCKAFQVHIVKTSSNKWNCKVCETKQTVLQVFGKGSGPECRELVKKLNEAKLKQEDEANICAALRQHQLEQEREKAIENFQVEEKSGEGDVHQHAEENESTKEKSSKWSVYLDQEKDSGGNYLY